MPETTQISSDQPNPNNSTLAPNTILLRRYKILGIAGGGGMGTVYKARDLNFPKVQRYAAVKEMHTPSTDREHREQTISNFQREANILATLNHPAIPKIFDFFDLNNRVYLVMEYINGKDLEAILSQTKTLPVDKVIEWAIDLCEVLAYLHSHQPDPIVFRDIKPSNIMIDSLGKVRLIDFGIAKTFISGGKHTMIGTEGYSAPEQYRGNVSTISDQYSLGATLHHILTRKDPRLQPPFSFNERNISDFNPNVPVWFVDIINKSLSFAPADRYGSCAEMGDLIKGRLRSNTAMHQTDPSQVEGGSMRLQPGGDITPNWTFKTEDEIRTTANAHENLVFVGSYDTNVWALDLASGEMRWKFATQGGIASSPQVFSDAGLVLFGSEDTSFNAVNLKTGRLVWSSPTKGRIRSTATIALNHAFFGSDDGYLYALVASNGRPLWTYETGVPIRTKPLVLDDLVVFGNDGGEIVALTLAGEKKWAARTKRSIESSPIFNEKEGAIYVGSHDGFMYSMDVASGYNSWRFRTGGPIISTPVLHGEMLIFGSTDKYLYAIDSLSSREKWRFETEKPIISSPVVHNDKVYFGGTDGFLYCLDVKSGKEQWKFKAEAAILSTPLIVDSTIILGSLDKTVYALPILD